MLISQLRHIVLENMDNASFSVLGLAHEVNISERHLNRNVKRITGFSVGMFIREIKLDHARKLLQNQSLSTVAEVARAVGFKKASYFSQIYVSKYGIRPSEYFHHSKE